MYAPLPLTNGVTFALWEKMLSELPVGGQHGLMSWPSRLDVVPFPLIIIAPPGSDGLMFAQNRYALAMYEPAGIPPSVIVPEPWSRSAAPPAT